MSPEQTRGESASSSSDLWGLGCILFEMLTASHPFKASNTADTIANVLKSSPSWESLPPGLPSPTLYLMRQCLERDAGSRLQSASAAYALLSTSLETIRIPVANSEDSINEKKKQEFSNLWVRSHLQHHRTCCWEYRSSDQLQALISDLMQVTRARRSRFPFNWAHAQRRPGHNDFQFPLMAPKSSMAMQSDCGTKACIHWNLPSC